MKQISTTLLALILASGSIFAQKEKAEADTRSPIGIKGGYSLSFASGKKDGFSPSNASGFMAGAFLARPGKGFMGFRSELIFSRQGYSYADANTKTEIQHDYIYLPQLTTFRITRFVQLQAGGQIGFLLNAKKTGADTDDKSITGLMNRIDYGVAGGLEIYPFKGLLIGARYNVGLGSMYKQQEAALDNPSPFPLPFNPKTTDLKNGSLQVFLGFKF